MEQSVRAALRSVVDPCSIATGVPMDVVDMGLVREIVMKPGSVTIRLRLTNPFCLQAELICQRIRDSVGVATGLRVEVEVDPTDDWWPEMMAPEARARLRTIRPLGSVPASSAD